MHEHLSVKVRFLVAEESNILITSSSPLDHSAVGATSLISIRPLDEYRLPFSPTLGCSLLPFEIFATRYDNTVELNINNCRSFS